MPSFRGNRVTRASGYDAGRGDNPHRTSPHPYQGNASVDTIGRYLGSTGVMGENRSHFFSSEATGGGETDSFMIHDTRGFQWNPSGDTVVGQSRFGFHRGRGHSGTIMPYDSKAHYGIPGAPMSDTPDHMSDDKFK